MKKKNYQAPDVELIGLSTYEICDATVNGLIDGFIDGQINWGGVDDGSGSIDPDANRWDQFDNKFEL